MSFGEKPVTEFHALFVVVSAALLGVSDRRPGIAHEVDVLVQRTFGDAHAFGEFAGASGAATADHVIDLLNALNILFNLHGN